MPRSTARERHETPRFGPATRVRPSVHGRRVAPTLCVRLSVQFQRITGRRAELSVHRPSPATAGAIFFPAIRKLYAGLSTCSRTARLATRARRRRSCWRKQGASASAVSRGLSSCSSQHNRPTSTSATLHSSVRLAVAVRKRRRSTMRGPKRFDIPTLVEDVETAFKEYPLSSWRRCGSTRATSWVRC